MPTSAAAVTPVEPDRYDNLAMFTARGIQIVAFANGEPRGVESIPMPEIVRDTSRHDLAWSPDGSQLAYGATITGTLEDHLFTVDLRSGVQTDVGRGGNVVWAPDGRSLLTVVDYKRVASIDLRDGTTTLLTDDSAFWSDPFFLPGYPGYVFAAGMKVVDMSGRGANNFVFYAIPLNGSQALDPTLWPMSGWGRLPIDIHVSPDGRWLLFTSLDPVGVTVMVAHNTVSVARDSGGFYQPEPEAIPTEYADALVDYNGLQYGWLPDSSGYLAERLFAYEIGSYDDPDYAIVNDFDRCVLDVVSPLAKVLRTLPLCLIEPAVNPAMTLLAVPVKRSEHSWVVRIYDLDGNPVTDMGWGYDLTFAP